MTKCTKTLSGKHYWKSIVSKPGDYFSAYSHMRIEYDVETEGIVKGAKKVYCEYCGVINDLPKKGKK